MDILSKLKSGCIFTGRNSMDFSLFNGVARCINIDSITNSISIECRRDGMTWKEEWEFDKTLMLFNKGDYYFI